jgi:pimeloyl-ACP methyl ester carboxylesterase
VDHLAVDFRPRVGLPPIFTDDQLRRLRMPVLVMVGDRDAIYSAGRVITPVRSLLPQAATMVVPGAGHVLLRNADTVTEFLTRA